MRPADMHLTPQELQSLLFRATDATTIIADSAAAQEAQQHLGGCAVCQQVAQKYTNANSLLRGLILGNKGLRNDLSGNESGNKGTSNRPKRGKDCPGQETWPNLAAGLINEEEATFYVSHAAQCDWCGPLLKESMEDLAQPVTEEEHEALEKLPSAFPGWQRAMAKKMASASGDADTETVAKAEKPARNKKAEKPARNKEDKEKSGSVWWPKLVWASAGLAVVIVAVLVGIRLTREPDVNALLAQAYTEQRTIELRMPGAKYGPMRVQRGGDLDLPAEFYRAEDIIKTESAKHPEDPKWLHAQAKAYILEWKYDNAIRELDHALERKPDDPRLLSDKAIALFERAQKNSPNSTMDYGEAAQQFSKVLEIRPDDSVALFNRAIVYRESGRYDEAISDFEHYLALDQAGPWADEAKNELQQLKKKTKPHQDSLNEPLAPPDIFAGLARDPTGIAKLNERIEDYQDIAIRTWLPEAYSPNALPVVRNDAIAALHALGRILEFQHHDRWLNHLLSSASGSRVFVAGLTSLRDAYIESGAGNWQDARKDAARAVNRFAAAENSTGKVRAQAELIYALQRSQKSDECLDEARKVEAELALLDYLWIKAQVASDHAGCSIKRGQFDEARKLASYSIDQSRTGDFPVLLMRGIGMACSTETLAGNFVAAWGLCQDGLKEYWEHGSTPPVRAHEFYDLLSYMSENMHWPNEALSFAEHSVLTVPGKLNVQVLARQHMAKIAIKAGKPIIARAALKDASNLLASAAASKMPPANQIYSEVMLADIEMQLGMLSQAESRLKTINPALSRALPVTRSFYRSRGELLAQQKRNDEAETEFLHAIQLVDSSQKQVTDAANRQAWNEENSELYRSLVSLEIARGDDEKALAIWEWYRSAELNPTNVSQSFNQFLNRNGVRLLAAQLGGQTLLSYFLTPHGLVVWAVDEHGVRSHFMPLNSADLVNLASDFSSMCADQDSDLMLLKTKGRQLFDTLIAPIANQVTVGRPIIIENDELMGDLPFQAFVTPQGHYLSQDYPIIFSPGLLYLAGLRPSMRLSPSAKAVIVASTANVLDEGMSLHPDEDAVPEGTEVAGRFVHPVFLQRIDATREKIRAALGKQEVLHFVSHGFSNIWNEGLLIYSNQENNAAIWNARDFDPKLFRKGQLVVLSACSTGRALQTRRESHGEMVRSLLRAGVPHVIASQWNIDSKATRDFIGLFYKALLLGNSASSSLRRAQVEMIENGPTSHPYYWAALVAFGKA
jgi:CHAT domain-containing protein